MYEQKDIDIICTNGNWSVVMFLDGTIYYSDLGDRNVG